MPRDDTHNTLIIASRLLTLLPPPRAFHGCGVYYDAWYTDLGRQLHLTQRNWIGWYTTEVYQ